MNLTAIKHIAWKEYRQQKAIWLMMLIGTIVMLWFASLVDERADVAAVLIVGMLLTGMYALVCSVTMYAGERDAGYRRMLQHLPVDSLSLLLGKMAVGLLGCISFVAITVICGLFLIGFEANINDRVLEGLNNGNWFLVLFVIPTAELFCLGLFFSLLMRRTILCMVVTYIAWVTWIFVWLFFGSTILEELFPDMYLGNTHPLVYFSYLRAVPLLLLIVINIALASRWLTADDRSVRRSKADVLSTTGVFAKTDAKIRGVASGNWFGRVGRFAWQSMRIQGLTMAVVVLAPLVFLFVRADWFPLERLALGHCIFAAAICGCLTFRPDHQGNSHRFISAYINHPAIHWIGRLAVGMVGSCIPIIAVTWAISPEIFVFEGQLLWQMFVIVAGCFCLSQLVSVYCKSSVIAMFFAVVVSSLFAAWILLSWWLGIPLFSSAFPIIATTLVSSLWMCYRWMNDATGMKSRLTTALPVFTVLIATVAAVPLYRIYQIPESTSGHTLSPELFSNTDHDLILEVEAIIQNAAEGAGMQQVGQFDEEKYYELAQPIMPLLDEIRADPDRTWMSYEFAKLYYQRSMFRMESSNFLWRYARDLEDEGRLDEALDCHLRHYHLMHQFAKAGHGHGGSIGYIDRWATLPGQSTESLKRAIGEIQAVAALRPTPEYVLALRMADPTIRLTGTHRTKSLWESLPFEKLREQRLIKQWLSVIQAPIRREYISNQIIANSNFHGYDPLLLKWSESTPRCDYYYGDVPSHIHSYLSNINQERLTLVKMALIAYAKEHGQYPDSLDDLVPTYFEAVPLHVFDGSPFFYSSGGLDNPIGQTLSTFSEFHRERQPFLMNVGAANTAFRVKAWAPDFMTDEYESYYEPFAINSWMDRQRFVQMIRLPDIEEEDSEE